MIKSLVVTNPKGESLTLELKKPSSSGLVVLNVTGLGPTKASIQTNELATKDGSFYSGARQEERNVVITLAMLHDVETNRQRTYKYFPIKKEITLRVITDNRVAECTGYVESHDPIIFAKDETTEISIICPDPFFYEIGQTDTVFAGLSSAFYFPFSNNSPTENLIMLGEIRFDTRAIFNYSGDSDSGVLVEMDFIGEASDIVIYNETTGESMLLDTNRIYTISGERIKNGDKITINTNKGSKYVRLHRDGKVTNIISALNRDCDWLQLSQGENVFAFAAGGGEENIRMQFSYRNSYGGI